MQRQFHTAGLACAENLDVFRDFIETACAESGVGPDETFALKLAMDEACSNIIVHGYAGLEPGSIALDLEIGPELVTLRITDFGRPFEPHAGQAPDVTASIEDRPIGGLGLFFIFNMMDRVDYHSGESGNTLILTKKRAHGD